jgi:hypothetical protein
MCQEEEDGAQAGPLPLLLPRPVYLAKFRAQGPGNLPGRPAQARGEGGGPAGTSSSSFWRLFRPYIRQLESAIDEV